MNENKGKYSLIRVILSVLSMLILILGNFDIIPQKIGIIAAALLLVIATTWNAVEGFKEGKKLSSIINLVAAVLMIALCIITLLL